MIFNLFNIEISNSPILKYLRNNNYNDLKSLNYSFDNF